MSIDNKFVLDVFKRYLKHLKDVKFSIEKLHAKYDEEIKDAENLAKFKPIYRHELDKLKKKKREADIKLSTIVPRMEKMEEYIIELENIT